MHLCFTIAAKRIKYLRNKSKVKDLHTGNLYTTLLKEIKGMNKWEASLGSQTGGLTTSILPKVIDRFNAIPIQIIQIPMHFVIVVTGIGKKKIQNPMESQGT